MTIIFINSFMNQSRITKESVVVTLILILVKLQFGKCISTLHNL